MKDPAQEELEQRQRMTRELLASPAYLTAYEDPALMHRPELRPIRMYLEFIKPELAQAARNIHSTVVVFGSARTLPPDVAARQLEKARAEAHNRPDDAAAQESLRRAVKRLEQSRYYGIAREFARIASAASQTEAVRDFVIVTGGGPGIMEAGNRGAHDAGAQSIGLNIQLPFEQEPNPYITPELCFNFRYFGLRKMHFLMRAKALVVCPGGFGTLDELFETLTLIQTRKVPRVPVILVGRAFWEKVLNLPALADEGVICPADLALIDYAESAEEAWEKIQDFWRERA